MNSINPKYNRKGMDFTFGDNRNHRRNLLISWQPISKALCEIYAKNGKINDFDKDEHYLRSAFKATEDLWNEQFNQITNLKVVMLSEAPLFGHEKSYIYNIKTKPTAFFHFNDLEALPNYDKALSPSQTDTIKRKAFMLDKFIKAGFLILDIFPFALNKETSLDFNTMSRNIYSQLLDAIIHSYLIPKLKLCLDKSDAPPHFVYRYKRSLDSTGVSVEGVLNKLLVQQDHLKLESINGTNMYLDREKLKKLF